jgi:putative ABC transport system permease protein
MIRIGMKTALAHPRRLLGTAFSVIIGVAFLAGTLVFTDTLGRTFDKLFADVYATTDVYVRSAQVLDTGFGGEQRGRLDQAVVAEVAQVPGIEVASGMVEGFARILGADGRPLGQEDGAPTSALSLTNPRLTPWEFVEGRPPAGPGEVAVDNASLDAGSLVVGQPVTIIGEQGSRTYTLVGAATFAGADSPGGATFALFDLATAQEFLGAGGKVDAVLAAGAAATDEDALATVVEDRIALSWNAEVLTGSEITAEQQDAIDEALSFFDILLLVFAGVALFVSSFIIYNTFSIVVAQRMREHALLRAVGASRTQLVSALLVEAVVIGVVASVLGFAGGIGVAVLLETLLSGLGVDLPSGSMVVEARTFAVSLAVGIGVTLLASVVPALRGSRVPPIAALRDSATEHGSDSRVRLGAGAAISAAGAILIAVGLTSAPLALAVGVPLLFVGGFVWGPLVARPVARLLGSPLPRLRGVTGRLARENATRNPKRTARTAAALMVGVALVTGITVLAASVKASVRDIFSEQFTGDLVVNTASFGYGGLSPQLAVELNQLPEVQAAAGVGVGFGRVDGDDQALTVIDAGTAWTMFDLGFVQGAGTDLTDTGILVSERRADRDGLAVGSDVRLELLDGVVRNLTVQGIYGNDELAGPYTVTKALYASGGADQFDFAVYVELADGVSESEGVAVIEPVADRYPNGALQTRSAYIDGQAASIDVLVNLMYGLLLLAVVIATVGIANTLSLSVFERTRELGLLRAVGMSRGQMRSIVRWESVLTALLGALQGVAVGIGLGYVTILALRDEGLGRFSLPVGSLAVVLALAVVAGIAAAVRPARRAARLDVLEAIAAE